MNRPMIALCLSASLAALGVSAFALLEVRNRAAEPPVQPPDADLRPIRELLEALGRRIAALEAASGAAAPEAPRAGPPASRPEPAARDTAAEAEIRGQVEALSRRLQSLEDGETIARLAESGEKLLAEKELRSAIAESGDPAAPPAARLSAIQKLLGFGKANRAMVAEAIKEAGLGDRDIILPALELARDVALDPELRVEAIYTIAKSGSKDGGLRQPLLELFAFDQDPEVRVATLSALTPHLGDPVVRETIAQASAADRHESVRETAEKFMPRIQYFEKRAVEPGGAAGGPGK